MEKCYLNCGYLVGICILNSFELCVKELSFRCDDDCSKECKTNSFEAENLKNSVK